MKQESQQTQGVDLEEFLEFYLLDSYEQVDRLGAGLLQLEKDGDNIALINDLFRSAHSLKGASGTMGFTPIVELTHGAEDLLDRVRQGKMNVSLKVIDLLLAVTDQVREMLTRVEQRQDIEVEYQNLTKAMKDLLAGEVGQSSQTFQMSQPSEESEGPQNTVYHDFAIVDSELNQLREAQFMGHGLYQISIKFVANTLMKAVRAMMAVQKMESCGTLVKLSPTIEELESGDYPEFFALVISDESLDEIREDILSVSELTDVNIMPYQVIDTPLGQEAGGVAGEEAGLAGLAGLSGMSAGLSGVSGAPRVSGATGTSGVPGTSGVSGVSGVSGPAGLAGLDFLGEAKSPLLKKPADAGKSAAANEGNTPTHTIRVDTVRMDNLINLVGEMVITRTRLVQVGSELKAEYRTDPLVAELNETNAYLGRLMNDLQESVMRLRMVPIGTVFSRFPRLVRDLAKKTGKEIDLQIMGEETELDKTVVEAIGDPLMHLIRNSVDHGIELPSVRKSSGKPETGKIVLNAYHEGNHIIIKITDDGQGLDLDKIRQKALSKGLIGEREELSEREIANLIFLPGFSTADTITDISGRGVGMDVVKKTLNTLGGTVDTDTWQGQGTAFTIRLPLTLAIIQALLVEVGQDIYAVPLSSVSETLLIKRSEIKTVGGRPMVQLRGNTLPLISLQEKFSLPKPEVSSEEVFVVVVGMGEKNLGLIVDTLCGQQEIVIKSLGDLLGTVPGIAGATILGDGKVTLILDISSLIQDILVVRQKP